MRQVRNSLYQSLLILKWLMKGLSWNSFVKLRGLEIISLNTILSWMKQLLCLLLLIKRPIWKEFKRTLKHKKDDISLDELANHLRVEEDCRMRENEKERECSGDFKGACDGATKFKKPFLNRPNKPGGFKKPAGSGKPNNQNQNQKKQKVTCWFCGKDGHLKSECYHWKRKQGKNHASSSAAKGAGNDNDDLIAMISEINVVENDMAWWVDSGATRHVCKNKRFFKTMEAVDENTVLYMGNDATVPVKGIGSVDLKFTSGKVVTLTNVYYAPEVRKNLVSGGLLNKFGFRLVFEADKFVLSKGGVFVGKGYAYEGMFKLNVIALSNKNVVSEYLVESPSFLWHHRLGHVHFEKII
ncbi:hypothetical protein Scep_026302 [Stephania cephalantha]|uniref:CCHC-type domain-containing protein n=1 Tax=Stephania cephalantha TaxID=152367 RepID=A0AAP0EQG6_9MAGN